MSAELPSGVDELGEAVAMDIDAVLGQGESVVHTEQGREHAGRLALGVDCEVGERCAVQVLDPSGYLAGGEVRQSRAFTGGGPGPPRHAEVPERRTSPR